MNLKEAENIQIINTCLSLANNSIVVFSVNVDLDIIKKIKLNGYRTLPLGEFHYEENENFFFIFDSIDFNKYTVPLYLESSGILIFSRNKLDRYFYENILIKNNYRKHSSYYKYVDYFGDFNSPFFIPFEPITQTCANNYDITWLLENRDLHMDMSRESGVRSESHLIRYYIAGNYCRNGDRVVDCACGLGYGSNILRNAYPSSKVIGIDLSERAIKYAQQSFNVDKNLKYVHGNAQDLSFIKDESTDLFVSFETLEHVPEPEKVIEEAYRILTAGGRIVVSVPYDWSDETGQDPNPYHFHVYNKQKIIAELSKKFIIEDVYIQDAGGGYKNPNNPKSIKKTDTMNEEIGEWIIVVGMKSPLNFSKKEFNDTIYPQTNKPTNMLEFSRDYNNPWLMRSVFGIGVRLNNPQELFKICQSILLNNSILTADYGSALCVLGYQFLDQNDMNIRVDILNKISDFINEYQHNKIDNMHLFRWYISLLYLHGLFDLQNNKIDEAIIHFSTILNHNWENFSPTLATKATEAAWLCGLIYQNMNNIDMARHFWKLGLESVNKILKSDIKEIIGSYEYPIQDGLREVSFAFDIARKCSMALENTNLDSNISHKYFSSIKLRTETNEHTLKIAQFISLSSRLENEKKYLLEKISIILKIKNRLQKNKIGNFFIKKLKKVIIKNG